MRRMRLSNRAITALAIAPNVLYVIGLMSLMATRLWSGLEPLPNGATTVVMALSVCVPVVSVAAANIVRLRRDA